MNLDTDTALVNWRELTELGFRLIPVPSRQKSPIITWKEFQQRAPTAEHYRRWFSRATNVAILTGACSGIVVLDLDGPEALAEAERRGIPPTRQVITGRGRHLYYRYPGRLVGNSVAMDGVPGLDRRGDGGLVIAPPSIHPTGRRYEWAGTHDIAEAPEWLVARRHVVTSPEVPPPPRRSESKPHAYGVRAIDLELADFARAAPGTRNHRLNQISFRIGQLVEACSLDLDQVRARIRNVALFIDLQHHEIEATMNSGLRAGMANPRSPF